MQLFETRPTTLHKKYSYVYISDDFHLRVECMGQGTQVSLVTGCHTEIYIDPSLSFGGLGNTADVCWGDIALINGVSIPLTKDEVRGILGDLPSMLLNSVMCKVSKL